MTGGRYNVVLECTGECRGYAGTRSWTSFKDKEEFQAWYAEDVKKRKTVVAKGISFKKATDLARQTPLHCDLGAAFEEAKDPLTGRFRLDILDMVVRNVMLDRYA